MLKKIKDGISESINSRIQCCFCGETLVGEKPINITLRYGNGDTQDLWSHSSCLTSRLHHSVPFGVSGD
jgi:hypothetical protein